MSGANVERHSMQRGHFSMRGIAENQKPGFIREIWLHSTMSVCVVLKAQAGGEAERRLVGFALMVRIKYF